MRYADLNPFTQFLLIGLVTVALAALLTRAMIFFHLEKAGVRPIFPSAWSAVECRALESFRLLIGLALIPLWGSLLFIAPSMPTSWPFGYLDVIFIIWLLLISNAWVLLLVPRNWKMFGALSRSFWLTITFLVVWWGAVFAATGWMFVMASAAPPHLVLPFGVFAVQGVPPLARTAS